MENSQKMEEGSPLPPPELQISEDELKQELDSLRNLRRRSLSQPSDAIDPDLPAHSSLSINTSSPTSPASSISSPASPTPLNSFPLNLSTPISSTSTSPTSTTSSNSPVFDPDTPLSGSERDLFWVPARLHPGIAPLEFQAFLKEQTKPENLMRRSGSLTRKKSMLSRQYEPSERDGVGESPLGGGSGGGGGGGGVEGHGGSISGPGTRASVGIQRGSGGSTRVSKLESLTIDDLQRLDQLATQVASARNGGMDGGPSGLASDFMIASGTSEVGDSPIIVPPPGQIIRRVARTKIRKPSLQGDGGGHRFGARRSKTLAPTSHISSPSDTSLDDTVGGVVTDPTSGDMSKRESSGSITESEFRSRPLSDASEVSTATDRRSSGSGNGADTNETFQTSFDTPSTSSSSFEEKPIPAIPVSVHVDDLSTPAGTTSSPDSITVPLPIVQDYLPGQGPNAVTSTSPPQPPPLGPKSYTMPMSASEAVRTLHTQTPIVSEPKSDHHLNHQQQQQPAAYVTDTKQKRLSPPSPEPLFRSPSRSPVPSDEGRSGSPAPSLRPGSMKEGKDKKGGWSRLFGTSSSSSSKESQPSSVVDDDADDNQPLGSLKKSKGKKGKGSESAAGKEKEREKEKEKAEKESGFFGTLFGSKKKHEEVAEKPTTFATQAYVANPTASAVLTKSGRYTNFYRLPIHVERAVYRLSHIKLANPRRPLYEQVLISNLMFWYLSVINKPTGHNQGHGHPHGHGPHPQQQQHPRAGGGQPNHDNGPNGGVQRGGEGGEPVNQHVDGHMVTGQEQGGPRKAGPGKSPDPRRPGMTRSAEMPVKPPQYDIQNQMIDQEYSAPARPSSHPPSSNSNSTDYYGQGNQGPERDSRHSAPELSEQYQGTTAPAGEEGDSSNPTPIPDTRSEQYTPKSPPPPQQTTAPLVIATTRATSNSGFEVMHRQNRHNPASQQSNPDPRVRSSTGGSNLTVPASQGRPLSQGSLDTFEIIAAYGGSEDRRASVGTKVAPQATDVAGGQALGLRMDGRDIPPESIMRVERKRGISLHAAPADLRQMTQGSSRPAAVGRTESYPPPDFSPQTSGSTDPEDQQRLQPRSPEPRPRSKSPQQNGPTYPTQTLPMEADSKA